jgi:hypothetical protein
MLSHLNFYQQAILWAELQPSLKERRIVGHQWVHPFRATAVEASSLAGARANTLGKALGCKVSMVSSAKRGRIAAERWAFITEEVG